MNNKAFTLIELLAVIIILGLLLTLTTPQIMDALDNSKEKIYDRQKELIETAAERWAVDNMQKYTSKEYITVEELKNEGYLNKNKVNNPKTKEKISGCVFITKNKNKYKYEYSETCTK